MDQIVQQLGEYKQATNLEGLPEEIRTRDIIEVFFGKTDRIPKMKRLMGV